MIRVVPDNPLVEIIGGVSSRDLDGYLQNSDYNTIRAILAVEPVSLVRLRWLREHALGPQFHAVLMCELALEEFERQPTMRTALQVSMPLIEAARFRALQDYSCCINSEGLSLLRNADALKEIYMQNLKTRMGERIEGYREEMLTDLSETTAQRCISIALIWNVIEETFSRREQLAHPQWALTEIQGVRRHNNFHLVPPEAWPYFRKRAAIDEMMQILGRVNREIGEASMGMQRLLEERTMIIWIQNEIQHRFNRRSTCCSIS
ncbi:MAG TPA: hypothetical protein VJK48_04955 [Chlamydiales bacterium]|nr:hypothetical protein [Chlamydiales bacterium]